MINQPYTYNRYVRERKALSKEMAIRFRKLCEKKDPFDVAVNSSFNFAMYSEVTYRLEDDFDEGTTFTFNSEYDKKENMLELMVNDYHSLESPAFSCEDYEAVKGSYLNSIY